MVRESTGTDDKDAAKRLLKARDGAAATGQPVVPRVDRVRYDEVNRDLRRHYETVRGDHAVPGWAREAMKPLDAFFAGRRLVAITPTLVTDYAHQRRTGGAANGTVNRELAVLGRMLRLAYEHGKLARLPVVRKLKEVPPREGFFEREQYEAVRRRLKPDLRVAAAIA